MTKHTLGTPRFARLVDGRKLHYRIRGSGAPTVVFEAGMGFSGSMWGLVQPAVAGHTSAITYDRAGTGQSDPDSSARTIDRLADDLGEFLAQLSGPFILVGHSWGGPIIRRLAARQSLDIRGLVLVDQSDERDSQYFDRPDMAKMNTLQRALMTLYHVVGFRIAALWMLRGMPTDVRREIFQNDLTRKGVAISRAEAAHFQDDLRLLLAEPSTFEGIDTVVITGTSPRLMKKRYRPDLVQAHRATAAAMDRGRLIEANKSGHFIPITEPDVVIHQIIELISRIRAEQKQG